MAPYNSNGDGSTLKLHQQSEDLPSRSQPTSLGPLTSTLAVLSGGSPSYHLPVELLTVILNLLFPDPERRTKNDMANIYRLRLVSKWWKELIEGTPTLWTYVEPEYPAVVVRDCLRWSKDHLLQISIVYTGCFTVEALLGFLQLLQPQSHRWKTLAYDTSGMPNLDRIRIRHFLESPAPMLHSLHLLSSDFGDPWVRLAGGVAKGLKHLSLEDVSLLECADLLHGLETLRLANVHTGPVEELLSIFVRSPALRSFGFWGIAQDPSSATASATPLLDLVANSLEDVVIYGNDPRFIPLILSQVSMPRCKSLDISAHFAHDDFLRRILNDALAQFIPRIREALRLGGVARFLVVVGPSRYQEYNSLEIEGFRFCFRWYGITTESLTKWIRQLIAKLDFPLELEMFLSPPNRRTVEALGKWNELNVTKLRIMSARPEPASMDDAVSVLDFLGDVLVDEDGGLSWNFPNLRELDVCSAQFDLSRLLNMLNKRYVRDKEELGISIRTPPRIDLRVQDTTEARGATIIAAIERHWGVISLQKRTLDT